MEAEIMQLSFKDIKSHNTKLAKVLDDHNVEFELDPSTGEYVALLDLKRQKAKPPKRVRTYTLRAHRPATQELHTDCRADSLKRRPFGGNSASKSPQRSTKDKSKAMKRTASSSAMKTYIIINETKHTVMKQYQHLFPELDFYNMANAPILIGMKFLTKKIELFYNKQFEAVLRVKSTTAVDLAQVIYDFYAPKYKDSRPYLTQVVADLVYTVHKYRAIREVGIFHEFLIRRRPSDSLLFYLYLRQNFKFITFNYFFSHKTTEADPRELVVNKEKAFEILGCAMYFSEPAVEALKADLLRFMNKSKTIGYYDFLLTCLKANMSYTGMDLMARSLSLYNFKNNQDPYTVEREAKTDPSLVYYYHKPEVKKILYESKIKRARKISRLARNEQGNLNFDAIIEEIDREMKDSESRVARPLFMDDKSELGLEVLQAKPSTHSMTKGRANVFHDDERPDKTIKKATVSSKQINQPLNHTNNTSAMRAEAERNAKKRKTTDTPKVDSTGSHLEEGLPSRFGAKDEEADDLNQIMREAFKRHILTYINEFCKKHEIISSDVEVLKQTCFEMFYAKALKILSMIFTDNKDKFFELTRTEPNKDDSALAFWKDISAMYYEYRANEDILDLGDIDAFINRLLGYHHIKKEIDFLLAYQFNLSSHLENLIKEVEPKSKHVIVDVTKSKKELTGVVKPRSHRTISGMAQTQDVRGKSKGKSSTMSKHKVERQRSTKSLNANSKPTSDSRVSDMLRSIDGKNYFREFKHSLHQIIQSYKQDNKNGLSAEGKDHALAPKPLRHASTAKTLTIEKKPSSGIQVPGRLKSKSSNSLTRTIKDAPVLGSLERPRQSQGLKPRPANSIGRQTVDSLSKNMFDMKRLLYKNGGPSSNKDKLLGVAPERSTTKLSTPMFIKAVAKKSGKKPAKTEKEAALDAYVTKVKEPTEETDTVKLLRSSITLDRDTFDSQNDTYYMHELRTALGEPGVLAERTELAFKTHFNQTIQSLMYFKNLQLKGYCFVGKQVMLGPKDGVKKTLVFDLDETLIHCNADQNGPCDARIPVTFPNGDTIMAGVNIRPFAREMLSELAQDFEIVVFTASHSCYANPVVDFLDTEKVVKVRLFRENCSQITDGLYTKDLSVFGDRSLTDIILVDNAAYSFVMQLGNGVPIIPFYDEKSDRELLKLKSFLLTLRRDTDVREKINAHFRWQNFLRYAFDPDQLLKKLSK